MTAAVLLQPLRAGRTPCQRNRGSKAVADEEKAAALASLEARLIRVHAIEMEDAIASLRRELSETNAAVIEIARKAAEDQRMAEVAEAHRSAEERLEAELAKARKSFELERNAELSAARVASEEAIVKSQLEERARSEKEKADAVHDARAAVEKQRSADLDAAKLAFEAETRAAILTAERDLEVRFSDERTRTRRQTEDAQQDLIKQLQQEAEERTQAVNDAKRIAAEQMEVETAAMQAEHEERIAEIANVRWQANEEHEKRYPIARNLRRRSSVKLQSPTPEETLTKLFMARLL